MAVNDVYRPNVDYTLATQVTSPVSGKTAFVPTVSIADSGGTEFDFAAVFGSPTDAAWNGTDPSATVIALLKAIALNTSPA